MRGKKSKCLLEFYSILSVTVENICKQIILAAKLAIQFAIANLHKRLDMQAVSMGFFLYSTQNLRYIVCVYAHFSLSVILHMRIENNTRNLYFKF